MCRMMFYLFISLSWISFGTNLALAGSNWFYSANDQGIAIDGYDPVAYFKAGKAGKGKASLNAEHQGLTYYFQSEANRNAFQKEPQTYLPQFGGWCAFACGVDEAKYGFGPVRFAADPEVFKIINNKLYLFAKLPNFDALKFWNNEKEADMISRAESFWKDRQALARSIGALPKGMHPRAPMETAQFAPLIGTWDNKVKWMRGNNTYGPEIQGHWTIEFGWEGFGISDNWRQVGVPGSGGPAHRFYDPKTKKWVMTYIPANQPRDNVWVMQGAFNDAGELHGELEGVDAQGRPFLGKIRFYNIQKDSFQWEHHRSMDGGKTWIEKVTVSESKRLK